MTALRHPIVIAQTVLPDYRDAVFGLLREQLGSNLLIVTGSHYFDPTHQTRITGSGIRVVTNRYFAGRRLLWQAGVTRPGLGAAVLVSELNPRVLSTWLLLIVRRVMGRPTVLWGHAWPRRGQGARTDAVRNLQRSLANAIIVYTRTEADDLKRRMPEKPVYIAANAIYRAADVQPVASQRDSTKFLFTGRLVPAKKPLLLLEAFALAVSEVANEVSLVFVGEGPQRRQLEQAAARLRIADRVKFLGHVPPDHISEIYADVIASVSPGYVGLSLTQSLAHGVPMLIARNEPHAPEVEAASEGENARFFESDSPQDLSRVLVQTLREREHWSASAQSIAATCRDSYSAEKMAEGIMAAISDLTPVRGSVPA
jgi:glycosyltransferase involved in cell wall biosynthesis